MSSLLKPIVRDTLPPFDKESIKGSLSLAEHIVNNYSEFISTSSLGEHFVLDVNTLPYPKGLIITSYKLWLSYLATDETIETAMVQFPLLSSYQENLGKKPRELFKREISISGTTFEEVTAILDDSKAPKLIADIDLIKIMNMD